MGNAAVSATEMTLARLPLPNKLQDTVPSGRTMRKEHCRGFTLVELLMAITMLGTIASIGILLFSDFHEMAKIGVAIAEIRTLEKEIMRYGLGSGTLPNTLTEVGWGSFQDPWGNPYEYLKIACEEGGKKCNAPKGSRRDRFLKPLNSDYDLYSKGKNGETKPQLSGPAPGDDIIRANDGAYVGLASEY